MAGGKLLILGGIRSGKSEYAESLLDDASQVRYVATSAAIDDETFAQRLEAHKFRRPASWETVETGSDPALLPETISKADPQWPLLVDDLGGWATTLLGRPDASELVDQLAEAVRSCTAQVILVSPEVGLSVVPATPVGVEFADLLGELNQAVAAACDEVTLIVAGQPTSLKKAVAAPLPTPIPIPAPIPPVFQPPVIEDFADTRGDDAFTEVTRALPIVETGVIIRPGMDLPIHDDIARADAEIHLSKLDIPGSGLGSLARVVVFAAGTQGRGVPLPWKQPHLLVLHGMHEGDIAAGDDVAGSAREAEAARRGEGPLAMLAAQNQVTVKVVEAPVAGDIAYGQAATAEVIEQMLKEGWRLVDEAVDAGADLIIVGSCGAGAEATAAAVTARITGAEIAALLGRIVGPDGKVDDSAWMLRCAAARDALHRSRNKDLNADTILAELGGPDFAIIAGIILGATARHTAVLLDGPVGTAAGLLARDLGSQSRLWCGIADFGGHPTTKAAADVLGLNPLLDLKVGLGEGSMALLALPLMRSALTLASTLPVRPEPAAVPPGFDEH